ncbi:unnamed protein product, partial [marine sediment metagenome]
VSLQVTIPVICNYASTSFSVTVEPLDALDEIITVDDVGNIGVSLFDSNDNELKVNQVFIEPDGSVVDFSATTSFWGYEAIAYIRIHFDPMRTDGFGLDGSESFADVYEGLRLTIEDT